MYYKGAMMLQTLRTHLQNDQLFFATLKKFCLTFQKSIIDGTQVVDYFTKELKMDLSPFFATYLTQAGLPILDIHSKNKTMQFVQVSPGFKLNVAFTNGKKIKYILLSDQPAKMKVSNKYEVDIRRSFILVEN